MDLSDTRIDSKHKRFLKAARSVSLKSQGLRRQFGCVLVDGKRILSVGHNKRSHPKIPNVTNQNGERKFWGLHAEISALLRCTSDVRGAFVYIWGQNSSTGNLVYSGPCDLCQKVLKERGVSKAIYPLKVGGFNILDIN